MAWFNRTNKGIKTATKEKKDTPEGLWHKTPTGKIIDKEELEKEVEWLQETKGDMQILIDILWEFVSEKDVDKVTKKLRA